MAQKIAVARAPSADVFVYLPGNKVKEQISFFNDNTANEIYFDDIVQDFTII